MENEHLILPDIVQQTLSVQDLAQKKPWIKHVDWKDQLCDVINLIPYCGGFIASEIKSIIATTENYHTSEFFRKFITFIYSLEISDKDRIDFLKELEEKANDTSGNVMLNIIDHMDNINKQKILANLVKAKGERKISIEDFFRLTSVLERIPYVDLKQLPRYQKEYYDEDGDTELLYSTGVLRPTKYHPDGDRYVLSPLGVKLLRYGLETQVEEIQITGTSTGGLEWGSFDELQNEETVKEIVKKTIAEQKYKEEDREMFDYDVWRGK